MGAAGGRNKKTKIYHMNGSSSAFLGKTIKSQVHCSVNLVISHKAMCVHGSVSAVFCYLHPLFTICLLHISVCVSVCVRGSEISMGFILSFPPFYSSRQGLSVEPSLHHFNWCW